MTNKRSRLSLSHLYIRNKKSVNFSPDRRCCKIKREKIRKNPFKLTTTQQHLTSCRSYIIYEKQLSARTYVVHVYRRKIFIKRIPIDQSKKKKKKKEEEEEEEEKKGKFDSGCDGGGKYDGRR